MGELYGIMGRMDKKALVYGGLQKQFWKGVNIIYYSEIGFGVLTNCASRDIMAKKKAFCLCNMAKANGERENVQIEML